VRRNLYGCELTSPNDSTMRARGWVGPVWGTDTWFATEMQTPNRPFFELADAPAPPRTFYPSVCPTLTLNNYKPFFAMRLQLLRRKKYQG